MIHDNVPVWTWTGISLGCVMGGGWVMWEGDAYITLQTLTVASCSGLPPLQSQELCEMTYLKGRNLGI